jgi:serine protease Do
MKWFSALALVCALVLPAQAQQAGWLGVSIEDGKDQGATVRSVDSDSPASKAGLKADDLILEYNKTPVLGSIQLTRLIRETPTGRTVDVKIRRGTQEQTLKVTVEAMTSTRRLNDIYLGGSRGAIDLRNTLDNFRMAVPRIQMSMSYTRAGIRVDDMTPQLRTFFGVSGNDGVLVTSVDSNSSAEKGGLKAGDVVVAVDSQRVRTPAEFDREMRASTNKVVLRVVRDKKEMDITVDRTTESRN